MKFKTLLITTIGAFVITSANADHHGKAVVEESADIGATLAVGYNSHYINRGVDNGESQITTQVDYDLPDIPISVGVWYSNPTSGSGQNPAHGDELNLYATLTRSFGSVDAWLGYTAYLYPEGPSRAAENEIRTGIGTAVGPLDLAVGVYYDLDIEGWFFDATLSYSYVLCDSSSLELAAGIAYSVDYNSAGSEFNNVLLVASVPISLTDRATLKPYIAGTLALDAIDGFQDDELFGGISLSVAF